MSRPCSKFLRANVLAFGNEAGNRSDAAGRNAPAIVVLVVHVRRERHSNRHVVTFVSVDSPVTRIGIFGHRRVDHAVLVDNRTTASAAPFRIREVSQVAAAATVVATIVTVAAATVVASAIAAIATAVIATTAKEAGTLVLAFLATFVAFLAFFFALLEFVLSLAVVEVAHNCRRALHLVHGAPVDDRVAGEAVLATFVNERGAITLIALFAALAAGLLAGHWRLTRHLAVTPRSSGRHRCFHRWGRRDFVSTSGGAITVASRL